MENFRGGTVESTQGKDKVESTAHVLRTRGVTWAGSRAFEMLIEEMGSGTTLILIDCLRGERDKLMIASALQSSKAGSR